MLRLLSRLPLPVLYALAPVLYCIVYYLARYRRDVVSNNLSNSFPEKSPAEITQLGKQFYRQAADVLVEIIKSPTLSAEEIRERVVFTNPEILQEHIDAQQSMLLLAAHHCNWEWLLPAASLQFPFPLDVVYKPLHQQKADEFMLQNRSRFDAKPIPYRDAFMQIMQRRKEFRAFAMVADQSTGGADEKYWTSFLNQESSFQVGMAKIATMTKYPVYFLAVRRTRRGYYAVTLRELDRPPYEKGDNSLLEDYARATEAMILAQPEAWLWTNRKWKHKRRVYDI